MPPGSFGFRVGIHFGDPSGPIDDRRGSVFRPPDEGPEVSRYRIETDPRAAVVRCRWKPKMAAETVIFGAEGKVGNGPVEALTGRFARSYRNRTLLIQNNK